MYGDVRPLLNGELVADAQLNGEREVFFLYCIRSRRSKYILHVIDVQQQTSR